MKILFLLLLLCTNAYASDTHERGDSHKVTYVVTDSDGNPVSGQTVRIQLQRVSDDAIYDFSSSSFKFSGWTTRYETMTYSPTGEYYYRVITPDSAINVTTEYCAIVSNDNATYGDQQTECFVFGRTNDLVRIHR